MESLGLTLKTLEEIGALSHEITEWVGILILLAVARSSSLTVSAVVCLIAKVHLIYKILNTNFNNCLIFDYFIYLFVSS